MISTSTPPSITTLSALEDLPVLHNALSDHNRPRRALEPLCRSTTKKERDELHDQIVQEEIAVQKDKVLFKGGGGEGSGDSVLESSINAIYPKWLKDRKDFQQVFPRFACEEIDHATLVEIAMSKESSKRTKFDLEQVLLFVKRFPVFKTLPPNLCEQLCRLLVACSLEPRKVLFKQGEPVHSFYMVVRGAVDMVDAGGWVVSSKRAFECFGEQAILNGLEEVQQYSGVVSGRAQGDTFALKVSVGDFRHMRKLFQENARITLSTFLNTKVSLFKPWSKHRVNQISQLFRREFYSHGQVVHKAYSTENCTFKIIHSGTCRVHREITCYRTNRWPRPQHQQHQQTSTALKVQGKSNLQYEERTCKKVESIHLAELKEGDYFGEEFLFGEIGRSSVTACGPVQVLVLSAEDAKRFIPPKLIENSATSKKELVASEDEIRLMYERRHRLHCQYENLKRSAFGLKYKERQNSRTPSKTIKKASRSRLNASQSTPLLPSLQKKSTKQAVHHQSHAQLSTTQ